MVRIIQSERSISELKEIWSYIAERNERAADKMLRRIEERIHGLREFPKRGAAREDIGPSVRQLVNRPYVILYEYRAEEGVVEILAVLHGMRDLPSAL